MRKADTHDRIASFKGSLTDSIQVLPGSLDADDLIASAPECFLMGKALAKLFDSSPNLPTYFSTMRQYTTRRVRRVS